MVKNSEKTKTNGKKRNDEDETVNKYEDETFTMVNNVKEVRKEPTKVSAMKTKKKRGRDKPKVKGSCSKRRREE